MRRLAPLLTIAAVAVIGTGLPDPTEVDEVEVGGVRVSVEAVTGADQVIGR